MDKLESLISATKLNDFLKKQEKVEEKKSKAVCIFAIIGAIIVIGAVIYGIYKYFKPDYLEDFEDDYEDDDEFDEDFFEDEFDC